MKSIQQIRCFLEVVRCGMNFTRAAQKLFITQPVLSRHISFMETDLGISLFDTSNKKAVALTPAGKILYDFFEEASRGFEEALAQAARAPGKAFGEVRIACVYGWDVFDIMEKADRFSKKYPDTNIVFVALSFEELARGLRRRDFDIAFTALFSIKHVPDIFIKEIEDCPLSLLYSTGGGRFSDDSPPKTADFKNDTLYALPLEASPVSLEMYTLSLGFVPKLTVLPNFDTIFMQIQGGRGYMVISHRMRMKDSPSFRYLDIGITEKNVLAWRKDNGNIAAQKFIDEYFGQC